MCHVLVLLLLASQDRHSYYRSTVSTPRRDSHVALSHGHEILFVAHSDEHITLIITETPGLLAGPAEDCYSCAQPVLQLCTTSTLNGYSKPVRAITLMSLTVLIIISMSFGYCHVNCNCFQAARKSPVHGEDLNDIRYTRIYTPTVRVSLRIKYS